jgi:hypothetical protein
LGEVVDDFCGGLAVAAGENYLAAKESERLGRFQTDARAAAGY